MSWYSVRAVLSLEPAAVHLTNIRFFISDNSNPFCFLVLNYQQPLSCCRLDSAVKDSAHTGKSSQAALFGNHGNLGQDLIMISQCSYLNSRWETCYTSFLNSPNISWDKWKSMKKEMFMFPCFVCFCVCFLHFIITLSVIVISIHSCCLYSFFLFFKLLFYNFSDIWGFLFSELWSHNSFVILRGTTSNSIVVLSRWPEWLKHCDCVTINAFKDGLTPTSSSFPFYLFPFTDAYKLIMCSHFNIFSPPHFCSVIMMSVRWCLATVLFISDH